MNGERIIVIFAILSCQICSLTCNFYPRESPIAVFSNYVKPVNLPPLKLVHSKSDRLLLNNTGSKLILTLDQEETSSMITGGTLLKEKYTFNRNQFVWNGYLGASTSHTIDGRGAPLEFLTIYTNVKCKTFENCLSYSDGLVILAIPVFVEGHVDNPLFDPLKKALQKSIYPSSKPISTTGGGSFLQPFLIYEEITSYFSYPGSYIELSTNKFSHCSTVILVPDYIRPVISIEQFQDSFLLLQNIYGSPLNRPLALFGAGNRPVVQANGTRTTIAP